VPGSNPTGIIRGGINVQNNAIQFLITAATLQLFSAPGVPVTSSNGPVDYTNPVPLQSFGAVGGGGGFGGQSPVGITFTNTYSSQVAAQAAIDATNMTAGSYIAQIQLTVARTDIPNFYQTVTLVTTLVIGTAQSNQG
jgi:hypothetical protein